MQISSEPISRALVSKQNGQRKEKNRVLCKNGPKLILANEISTAEKQLAIVATTLDANKYNAVLRLDAVLQLRNPFAWLEELITQHSSWIWLNPLSPAGDLKPMQ